MRALYRASIWHPTAVPAVEGVTSHEMKRYVLPMFDLLIIGMGVNAVARGMPSFNIVFNDTVSFVAGWVLLAAGVLALVGVSFPRLWVAEAVGKLGMIVVLGGYASTMWVLIFDVDENHGFSAAGLTALCVLPMWNLARLGRERRWRSFARNLGVGES